MLRLPGLGATFWARRRAFNQHSCLVATGFTEETIEGLRAIKRSIQARRRSVVKCGRRAAWISAGAVAKETATRRRLKSQGNPRLHGHRAHRAPRQTLWVGVLAFLGDSKRGISADRIQFQSPLGLWREKSQRQSKGGRQFSAGRESSEVWGETPQSHPSHPSSKLAFNEQVFISDYLISVSRPVGVRAGT